MPLPQVKVRKAKKPRLDLPAPHRPRVDNGDEPELLTGEVKGMKASMAEERFATALNRNKAVDGYEFRFTVGAPRGLPGWKEIDYLVNSRQQVYLFEIDSAFTHRSKGQSDKLHDAIVLKEIEKLGFKPYPQVFHIDGEVDLIDTQSAKRITDRYFQ